MKNPTHCILQAASLLLLLSAPRAAWAAKPPTTFEASHQETAVLCGSAKTKVTSIKAFCLRPDGNLLVSDEKNSSLKLISAQDEFIAEWKLDFPAGALVAVEDGSCYAAGKEHIVRLDALGKVTAKWSKPQKTRVPGKSYRSASVTGLAATKDAVYMSVRGDTGYDIIRLTLELKEPKTIIKSLRGCCGQMDIDALGDKLLIAENARHQVGMYDREGKLVSKFGKRDRSAKEGFGSCCGPMNVTVSGGIIYTGETVSPAALIKAFDAEGKQLAVIGSAKGPASCTRMTLGASPDGNTVYMLDGSKRSDVIRVLERKQP